MATTMSGTIKRLVSDKGFGFIAAGDGFETTPAATAAFGAIDVNDHVPNFTRGMIEAAVELAVNNETTSDSCADENADYATRFGFELDDVNAQNGDVAVVFDEDRHAQLFFEILL